MRVQKTRPHPRDRVIGLVLVLSVVGTGLSFSTGCAPAPSRPAVEVRADHRPARPHPHAHWIEGHWTYQQGRYHWVRGSWAR